MNIALLAPFEEPVPPKKYGGTERVVGRLAEELVAEGHNVTLLASGDSRTDAKLIACVDRSIRLLPSSQDSSRRQALSLQGLAKSLAAIKQNNFDIVHNHYGWQFLLFADMLGCPVVTTLHGTLDKTIEPTEHLMYNSFRTSPVISISRAQRRHAPKLNYVANIYNSVRLERFKFNNNPDNYLAFLGRVHPQKGLEYAIKIAKKTGNKLIIAAKIDYREKSYYKEKIRPLIDNKQIIFIGEVDHRQKVKLLSNAKALLSPIQWDEPFGLTNIEAMACGTPVISIRRGSMPEIIDNGRDGFLCNSVSEMAKCLKDISKIDRAACRKKIEQNFTAEIMASSYLKAYKQVIANYSTKKP